MPVRVDCPPTRALPAVLPRGLSLRSAGGPQPAAAERAAAELRAARPRGRRAYNCT
jgi:hypothetical protein